MDIESFGDEVVDKSAGVSHVVLFQELKKMTPAVLPAAPTTLAETVTISDDHAFIAPADGFLEGKIDETRSSYEGEDAAGVNVNAFNNKFTFFVPGDNKTVGGWLKQKPDLIVLIEGKACGVGAPYVQVGSRCAPARIESYKYKMGSYDGSDVKGYEVTIGNTDGGVLFYAGEAPIQTTGE